MPRLSGVYPQFFWLLSLLWALEIGALRGPSHRALQSTMEHKTVKMVALATFLPRKLAFLVPQHSQGEQVAATALRPACGLA